MIAQPKYLTVDEFVSRLGVREADGLLGSGPHDARVLDLGRASVELAAADDLIDGYVRARYPRPFAKVPGLLKNVAHDLARFSLRSTGDQSSSMSELVKDRYDKAIAILKDIALGRITLDGNGDGNQPDSGTYAETVKAYMPESRMKAGLEGYK